VNFYKQLLILPNASNGGELGGGWVVKGNSTRTIFLHPMDVGS